MSTSESAWLIPLDDHAVEGAPQGSLLSAFHGLTIGRGDFNAVQTRMSSRMHAQLTRTNPGWCIEDLQSTDGTFVDGVHLQRGPALLTPGCAIRCGQANFRFQLEPSTPLVFPMEQQLRARPDDEALWTVAGDGWLEKGLRWGERIGTRATGFPEQDHLLNDAVRCLGLEVEWRLGFARRALIHASCIRAGLSPEVVLNALLTHPLSRFLEQLHVDGLRFFDLRDGERDREDASVGFFSLLRQWLPPGLSNLEIGVGLLGTEGALEQVSAPLAKERPSLRQRYWLHGTLRMDPGGEVSPVFGAELDCQGLVRCAFQQLPGGTHALRVIDDVPVVIGGQLHGGHGTLWFPGETLSVKGTSLRFAEHTQTLLVVEPR